ncbi:hypothetical protein Dimus_018885 [Dionaea muscipula]
MDHLLTRRKVNLPRIMIRHMAYEISVPHHELPYGDLLTRVFELKREQGVWWFGTCANRRRDDVEEVEHEEMNVGENDVVEEERFVDEDVPAQIVPVTPVVQTSVQPKGKTKIIGVDSSGSLPDSVLLHLQVEMDRALKADTGFQELYQQQKSNPSTSRKP